jgi:ATP-dependent Lon protease
MSKKNLNIPLLPLRDVVIFPSVVTPLFVGREKSINALQSAMAGDKQIMLVAQKSAQQDDPKLGDLYPIGTLSTILQLIKLPDGTLKVLVEGNQRASIESLEASDEYMSVQVSTIDEENESKELDHFLPSLKKQFQEYVKLTRKATPEVLNTVNAIDSLSRLTDTLVGHLSIDISQKQEILEMISLTDRANRILEHLDSQLDLSKVEKKIRGRVKTQMEKSQKEYYLNEQMKALKKELGEIDEAEEAEELETKIKEAGMTKEAQEKALTELQKYKMMSPMSAEASVVRGYIDWMLNIPWKKKSKIRSDLSAASNVLNEDHFGLEEVKERILEYLAVQKRVKKLKGPVLCLVGPPGVGKTSLGESIARATNRKFVRMSLGGVRDEAEIRGHRRTYIGSMPGRILQKLSKTGVKNPLFLLDEIDKMGMDMRGDPASALLEVLDPEQNHTFNDHYLEVDYDLSDIMFVCTANSMNIPQALRDRMEIITLPGYTEDEKVNIADKYLVKKQKKNNGLNEDELSISKNTIKDLIRKICRKVVKKNATVNKSKKISIKPSNLEDYCGVRKFDFGEAEENDRIGQVTGLAWTQVGGELLTIEASSFIGKGKIIKTGSLGDVMQESIQAALSVVRSRSESLGIDPKFYEEQDIHIHVPEGATPKDGPSAGAAMTTALTSVLSNIPVRSDVAMTGEITLRGEVLKIGGLKEKLLAARRGGIKVVLIPEGNVRDLKEVPDNIKADLDIKPVRWIDEVLDIVLTRQPIPWEKEEVSNKVSSKKSRTKKSSVKAH